MKQRKKFPIKVEKNGVTVPVYRMRSGNGYVSYVILYRENGERRKQGFSSVAQARRAAKKAEHGVLQLHHAHLPPPLLDEPHRLGGRPGHFGRAGVRPSVAAVHARNRR